MPQQKHTMASVALSATDKRGRGRPPKSDALTPAARAKRYREKVNAKKIAVETTSGAILTITENTLAQLRTRLVELQIKYDLEHLTVIDLQTKLASAKHSLKTPGSNLMEKQVADLRKIVAEQQRIISAFSAQINYLRDALVASQKKLP